MKLLILLGVNLLMFWRTLFYSSANDDWEIQKCNCKIPEAVDAKDGRGSLIRVCKKCGIKERPTVGFWQMIRWHFLGLGYWKLKLAHSMTLGVHILNTTLIYLAFGHNNISFLAALLFAINPVATQGSSVWLSGRNYGTATLIVLLMKWIPILTPLLYIVTWRFALIGVPGPAQFIHSFWWFWIFLIPLMMFIMKKILRQATEMKYTLVSMTRKPFDKKNIILFFKSIGYCFCVCLFPTHLGVHHTYCERYGLTPEETKQSLKFDGFLVLGILLCIAMLYLFIFKWSNPVTFGLFWFFLFYLPWANICTIHQFFAERYVVLALIGLMYMFSSILFIIPYGMYLACAFVAYYAVRCQIYIKIYADVLRTAEHNCENFEDSAAAWRWRGGLERNLGLVNESFISYMKAWRLRPYDFVLCNNIAAVLCQRNQWEEAKKFMDMAEKCPLPTPELAEKWKIRQAEFRRVYNEGVAQRAAMIPKHPRNAICPECKIKYKRCKHGG
jgi:hypothetical protein